MAQWGVCGKLTEATRSALTLYVWNVSWHITDNQQQTHQLTQQYLVRADILVRSLEEQLLEVQDRERRKLYTKKPWSMSRKKILQ